MSTEIFSDFEAFLVSTTFAVQRCLGDKNSYDIGVFGFLLIKSWSVERDGKRFIKILEEPQNDGNVSVSSVQKCCI